MGIIISQLWSRLFGAKEFKVCLVGLDNAGKTTMLMLLHLGDILPKTQPTIGSNVEEIIHKNIKLTVWDLGGQESLRSSWNTYYTNANAIILMIDSTDIERLDIIKDELWKLLSNKLLTDAKILVYANKQDLPNKLSPVDISQHLLLHQIRSHNWIIRPC